MLVNMGYPPSTIERDYAQNWLLASLSRLPMALKGGTGIRKVYIENYRFSDDLDFTLLEAVNKDELQAAVQDAVTPGQRRERHSFRRKRLVSSSRDWLSSNS